MSRRVRVEVTAADIATGEPTFCRSCPVALALLRAGFTRVSVGESIAAAEFGEVPLPRKVASFVRHFDRGRPVKPFAFDLELPEAAS